MVLVVVVVVIFAVFSFFQKLRHEQSVAILKSNRDVRDRKISLDRGNGETGTLRTRREMSLRQVGEPKKSFNKTLYSNLHPLFIYKDPGSPKS